MDDKMALGHTLEGITRVPKGRACFLLKLWIAQIISWAANRTTTQVEDGAYSLMGLLGVNMPMLYGEAKRAFHLEIIRSSIFAWDSHPGRP